jgi:hypothetical protein
MQNKFLPSFLGQHICHFIAKNELDPMNDLFDPIKGSSGSMYQKC